MVRGWSSFISIPVIIIWFCSFLYGQDIPETPEPLPDSVLFDTTAVLDSSATIDVDSLFTDTLIESSVDSLIDSLAVEKDIIFPEENVPAYFHTSLIGKGYGDYLRYTTGILSLQHGSVGQPELLTKSVMLPGLGVVYNGLPVFHQGLYIPFRSGLDLNVLMFDNIGQIEITPLSYLGLFNQGEALSLNSMFWPSNDNPSSVTVAGGPYGYDRSAWRFSRRLTENTAATLVASFKEADGYYSGGADYDDFGVAGSFAMRPKPNTELRYTFYQHKARQGVLQFDRSADPPLRLNHDLNFHTLEGRHIYSEQLRFELSLFHQKNYSHLFDNNANYHYRVRDFIWGGKNAAFYHSGKHNLRLEFGGQRHYLSSIGRIGARSVTIGVVMSDSITLKPNQNLVLTVRARHNNINDYFLAGTIKFDWQLNDKANLKLSGGRLDNSPDIYSLYYNHSEITIEDNNYISAYSFKANQDLQSTKSLFFKLENDYNINENLSVLTGMSIEKVYDDMVPITNRSDTVMKIWNTFPRNISYDRLTLTADFNYSIMKYFNGVSGATYFLYDPENPLPDIKFTPSGMAYSTGELIFKEVLRDIDISGVYQLRFLTAREYSGFSSVIYDIYLYEAAVALDWSIDIRFGSFKFRLCENNILDFIGKNHYNVWGEYAMPPGTLWWQFTWNFEN